MKIKRKELWLFAAPLLVIAFAFLLSGVNNRIIRQEQAAQLEPSLNQNGGVMVIRQRQPDGSIKEFLDNPDGTKTLLNVRPANKVYKPKGLFQARYIIFGMIIVVVFSFISLLFVIISSLWRRKRNSH